MKLSKMNIEDLTSVLEIENRVFSDPWPRKFFEDDLNSEFSSYYVLKQEDEMIGYGGLWFMFENCDLVNIAIDSKHQGQGYGEKLLKLLIREAILKECEFMHLEVRKNNLKAFNLYEKLGFIKTRVRKGYYEDGEDAIDMVKGLIGLNEKDFSD